MTRIQTVKTVKNQIETKVLKSSLGEIFFADNFMKYGSPENIRKVLSRLVKEDLLIRISQGIYLKPKKDPVLGISYPGIEEIAKKIARRDKASIAPTGIWALHLLGLTTQIPLKAVYLTDGSQREVKIGNRTIKFRKTAPKSFAVKDEVLHLIVQAFKEIGQKEVSAAFLNRIKPHVVLLKDHVVQTQLKYAPAWIQKHLRSLYKPGPNVE